MKEIIISALLALFAISNHAPTNNYDNMSVKNKTDDTKKIDSFIISDGHIYWQHVFETDFTISFLANYFTESDWCGRMKINWEQVDSTCLCGISKRKLNYKPYEVGAMLTPGYITSEPCEYSVRIDLRNGKYRVTISNIRFDGAQIDNIVTHWATGASGTVTESWSDIEVFALTEEGFKRSFVKNVSPLLYDMWIDEYTIAEPQNKILSNEW